MNLKTHNVNPPNHSQNSLKKVESETGRTCDRQIANLSFYKLSLAERYQSC